MPGISAGLAAISANYGAIFDHQNNQDEQQQNSPMEENKLQQQNSYSVGSLSEQFPLVAAAAYAFRNPQSAQFHVIFSYHFSSIFKTKIVFLEHHPFSLFTIRWITTI